MIVASDIKKSYGDLQVLKGISLTIAPEEIVSIVGKSGAGKVPYFISWGRSIGRIAVFYL